MEATSYRIVDFFSCAQYISKCEYCLFLDPYSLIYSHEDHFVLLPPFCKTDVQLTWREEVHSSAEYLNSEP